MSQTAVSLDVAQNMSVKELLKYSTDLLNSSKILDNNEGRSDSLILFQHYTQKSRSWLLCNEHKVLKKEVSDECLDNFCNAISQRMEGKPVAYILGTQHFWTLDLEVNESTLIPRQDTEILIETVLELPLADDIEVLDLGTGTGAIALALAAENKHWEVTGVDRIEAAIELAKRNALRNNLQVSFYISQWFSVFKDKNKESGNDNLEPVRFDLIVSNPPYVEPDSEYLSKGDLRFEPNTALVANNQGLADLTHIIKSAPEHLKTGGYLVLEHGFNQAEAVTKLLLENGFSNVQTKNDYNQLPRVTIGQFL